MTVAVYVVGLAVLVIAVAFASGASVPPGMLAAVTIAAGVLTVARRMRDTGLASTGTRISQAAIASGGWPEDSFVMAGLEDCQALEEYTDEAGMYGYRREQGDDRYSWRFIREPRA